MNLLKLFLQFDLMEEVFETVRPIIASLSKEQKEKLLHDFLVKMLPLFSTPEQELNEGVAYSLYAACLFIEVFYSLKQQQDNNRDFLNNCLKNS